MLWMLASGLAFIGVNGLVRHMGTALPATESAFLRFAFGLALLLPAFAALRRQRLPRLAWGLFLGRGAIHSAAVVLWFFAMARIPVAEATAIGYLNPIAMTIGAALIFGERLAARRIAAIGVAVLGAAVILRPGLRELSPGHLSQLGAAICFAGSYLCAKRLTGLAPAGLVVAMMSLVVSVMLAPFALAVWVAPDAGQYLSLAATAALATLAHYCMTRAFLAAPVTVTQPVVFLQLVWAAALGRVVFGEPIDPFVILGGTMIIAAISYITFREAQLKRIAAARGR
ncbi:DMT family transporter [Frigidibacter sp. MR17.24]|uniref:DMT family transporter n=1 Tax=Frigidibacter sp. MR17.24 TaxID=3127345 RepID=UPI003FA6029E